MLTPENVVVVPADTSSCFVCDQPVDPTPSGLMITISFKLLVTVKKSAHIGCCEKLADLITLRVLQATTKSS